MRLWLLAVLLCMTLGATEEEEEPPAEHLHKLVIPIQTERLKAHFRIPAQLPFPVTPERVTNITVEKFREYAIRGQPIIITDSMRDWAGFGKWDCDYFSRTFPNEEVGGFTAYKSDALKWRKKLSDAWLLHREGLGIPKEEHDPKNPTIMSWYFSALGLDGTKGHDVPKNETMMTMIKSDFLTPYFVERTRLNNNTVFGRAEFFFGTDGAGVHPHTDPVCQWIMSVQVSGKKSWRLSLPYNIDVLEEANPGYKFIPSDGNVLLAIMMNRAAIYEFTLSAGEMIVFPPGMIHTTRAIGPECSTSLSIQFASPNPVEYIKEFSNDLISDVIGASRCYVDHFNNWLFGASIPAPKASMPKMRQFADAMFPKMDADKSGAISAAEALAYYEEMHRNRDSAPAGLVEDDPGLDAESFMLAHDVNKDSLVSKSEFDAVLFALWNKRMAQVAAATDKPLPVQSFFYADVNGDEYVTEEELKKTFPDADFKELLKAGDDDHDGRLFQSEFHRHTRECFRVMTGRDEDVDDFDADKKEEETKSADKTSGKMQDEEEESFVGAAPVLPVIDEPPPPPAAGLKNIVLAREGHEALEALWRISKAQGDLPIVPVALKDVQPEQFAEFARRGQPLIVSDGLRDMVASNMTCAHFKASFGSLPVTRCKGGCKWKTLGDAKLDELGQYWEHQALGVNTIIGGEQPVRSPETVGIMRSATRIPYFVSRDAEVNQLLHDDYLDWMFGTNGGSRGPYTDMTCFWSVFGQAQGSSHWKVTVPYNVRQMQRDNRDYIYYPPDGRILVQRMLSELPVYEFTLKQGEMLVLPPGLFKHFTFQNEPGECSVMFRSSFMAPPPTEYVKTLQENLMSDSDGAAGCYTDHYNRWLFGTVFPDSDGLPASNQAFVQRHFKLMDANKDGFVSLSEAVAQFPPKQESGLVRTPELDGAAFIQANDGNGDQLVSEQELLETVMVHWNPVMYEVGNMWFFVDMRNAMENGGWEEYGRYVDSIRFRYDRSFDVRFDDNGQPRPGVAVPSTPTESSLRAGQVPDRLPPGVQFHQLQDAPADFPLVVSHPFPDVTVVSQRDGNGLGFIFWTARNKMYVGPLTGGRRRGIGVFCCKNSQLFDQNWLEGDDDGKSYMAEPKSDVDVDENSRSEYEVVQDVPGLSWMGSHKLNGLSAIRWHNGDIYVGPMENGRRSGAGVLAAGGRVVVVAWAPQTDPVDWHLFLEL